MSWGSLIANVSAARDAVASLGFSAQSSKDRIRELKEESNSSAFGSLKAAALTEPYITLWMQLVAVDANHPALNTIEQALRERSNADLSWLSSVRSAARKMQQEKMRAHGARGRTKMSGALSEGELGDLIAQYTGGG